jgi:hypothetical protein
MRPLVWSDTTQPGIDPATAVGPLTESAESLTHLGATRRALLSPEDRAALDPIAAWTDRLPFVARRTIGRGEAWVVTLPFSVDASDLTLRPGFLALLDGWVAEARRHAVPVRTGVGETWKFLGASRVEVTDPAGHREVVTSRDDGPPTMTPALLGTYQVTIGGQTHLRTAGPDERELDLRPRPASAEAASAASSVRGAPVDVSGEIALALLALTAVEMALRVWSQRRTEALAIATARDA